MASLCMELMDLQLGLALSTNSGAYHNANTSLMLPTTLSLLPQHHPHPNTKDEKEEEGGVVGWPPLNYWRNIVGVDGNDHNNHLVWVRQHASSRTSSNSLYVKAKMEGVGIARKVDLCMHQSFQSLKETLMDMFGKCHQQSNSYQLAYQDKEGDWLLAQDIPWSSFVRCARRLKLVKSSR